MSSVPSADNRDFPAPLKYLPLTMSVRVGTATTTVGELAQLNDGSMIVLDSTVDAPVDICVEGRVIARGSLVEEGGDGQLAVKITEIVDTVNDE